MFSAEDMLEEKDDFTEFYQQYRPRNRSSYSPVEISYPRHRVYRGSSEAGTESFSDTFSSGYSSGHPVNREAAQYSRRSQPSSRSKSHGRDYQRADLMSFYHSRPRTAESEHLTNGYTTQLQAGPDDTLSRDSGHSSGGTPEFGRRSIVRYNSFPQPRQGVRQEGFSNNERMVEEQFNYAMRKPFDSYSLYGGQTDHSNSLNSDSMSLHSLDVPRRDWRYMDDGYRPKITPRRRYNNTPDHYRATDLNMNTTNKQKQESQPQTPLTTTDSSVPSGNISAKLLILLICLVTLSAILLLAITSYNKWRCSADNSHTLDIETLANSLSSNLIGQHLASSLVLHNLQAFSASQDSPVLVLLLVGMTGTGKTHTSNLVADIFSNQAVHTATHTQTIAGIPATISQSCGYNLVLVEDLQQEDKVMTNSLEKMIFTISNDSVSKSRGTVIVVTTKTGGVNINKFLLDLSKDNLGHRDKVTTEDIMKYFKDENIKIPLHRTLVDYNIPFSLIPFLPLTRDHVRECISSHLRHSDAQMNPKDINFLLDKMPFFSPDFPIFSVNGCKHVSLRVNAIVGGKRDL